MQHLKLHGASRCDEWHRNKHDCAGEEVARHLGGGGGGEEGDTWKELSQSQLG